MKNENQTEIMCPVCNVPLTVKEKNGQKIDFCESCNGMYLHKGQLNELTPHHHDIFSAEDLEQSSIDHNQHQDSHGPVPCGYCSNDKMIKINFLSMSDIILDYCENCGSLWIDSGEMQKIHTYWEKVDQSSIESHDPLMIQVINFFKAVTLPFFAAFLLFTAGIFSGNLFANEALSQLKSKVGGLYSSFTASFTYSNSGGATKSGKIYYQYPNKLHIRMSDGGVVATNGRSLWIYNPASGLCAKQDVGGGSGGLLGRLGSYEGRATGNRFVFRNPEAHFTEIAVSAAKGMVSSVTMRTAEGAATQYQFSGVRVGAGVKASLFNYKPPTSARVIENPLNN